MQPGGQYQATIHSIMQMLKQRRVTEAVNASLAFSAAYPQSNDALLLLAKARQMQGRFDDMLKSLQVALQREPDNPSLQLQFAGACQFCGRHDQAIQQLRMVERDAWDNAEILQNTAQLYVGSAQYEDAHRCFVRAVELDSGNAQFLNNLASSYIAVGNLQEAEATYDKLIARRPKNFEAWYNRSSLRKQTESSNHIRQLERLLKKVPAGDPRETPLCYTLAKEYEDLGKDRRSFSCLRRGADSFRRRSNYDVQLDVDLMRRIAELFDARYAASVKSADERRGPIFVLGLPRSGSTLVERILSNHSDVTSLGEITDLGMTLNRVAQTTDRRQLLQNLARLDPNDVGSSYLASTSSYGIGTPCFVDKTPVNFLYVGLIAKALPAATIIDVRRHPVDSCLSMYRALFREGYPFSYDLDDLASYYIAYHGLMRHWRETFPGSVVEVSYEALVDDLETVSKTVVSQCGLEWQQACAEFEKNRSPVATASAAQVRRPIYRDALARWRRFETQLAPLIEQLKKAGIPI